MTAPSLTVRAAKADLILVNGHVLTMSGRGARALAVVGERIAAVGAHEQILPLRGRRTRVIDLQERLALPGFTDSHVHLGALAHRLWAINLQSARTLADALRRVAGRARAAAPGAWLTGGGFDKNRWGDEFPNRSDLDAVAPDNPVALSSRDGHSLWVNSLALKRCGITARTPAPTGGVIPRDARARPTGILQEAATRLIYDCPAFDRPVPGRDGLSAALRHLLRMGITSVHLMEEMPLLSVLQELRETGDLCPRVTFYRHPSALRELVAGGTVSGSGDEWLRIGGIKVFLDGTLGSQTAWLFEPHGNSEAGCGVPVLSRRELRDIVGSAAKARVACAIHAIGDRANAEALDVLAEVCDIPTPLPHRIEHAQLLRPQDIRRFARVGVVASMQPCHIPGDIDPGERYWGSRCRWAYAIRSLLRGGTTLAFGSDAPVETANPLAGLYAAVRRQKPDGSPRGGWYRREEGITVAAALRAYTVGPAVATGESAHKGRLEAGCLADIVVLSGDITRRPARRLLDTRVDLVFVGGRLRYRRRGAP